MKNDLNKQILDLINNQEGSNYNSIFVIAGDDDSCCAFSNGKIDNIVSALSSLMIKEKVFRRIMLNAYKNANLHSHEDKSGQN